MSALATPLSTPTAPPRTPPSLLTLPAEIRDQIYSYCLSPGYIIIHGILGTPISARNENADPQSYRASVLDADLCSPMFGDPRRNVDDRTPITTTIKGEPFFLSAEPATPWPVNPWHHETIPDEHHLWPAILRVCRQMYSEGTHRLYAANMFDFVCEITDNITMKRWWWSAQERVRVRMFLDMIGPCNASLIRKVGLNCPEVWNPMLLPAPVTVTVFHVNVDIINMLRQHCPDLRAVEMTLHSHHPLIEAGRHRTMPSIPHDRLPLLRSNTEEAVTLIDGFLRGTGSEPSNLRIVVIPINQMQPQDQKLHDEMKGVGWKIGRDLVLQRKIGVALRKCKDVVMNPSWHFVGGKLLYS